MLNGPEANIVWSQIANDHLRMGDFRQQQNAEYGVGKTIVSSDGQDHSRLRKVLKHGYSRAVLDDRYPEVIAITQRAADDWQPGQSIAVMPFMAHVITQQLGSVVLNYAPGDYLDKIPFFLRMVILVTLARRWPASHLEMPSYRHAKARVMELTQKMLEAHRCGSSGQRQPDLIDDLLAAAADDTDFLSDAEMQIATLGPYIGGLDTVASTCAFMLYALMTHPEILERVNAEVDAAFAAGGPSPHTLKAMESLHHTLLETLRLYPVTPALQGTVAQPFEFAGYRVEPEQPISICIAVPHFLPQFYPDPYTFDIDRYSKARQEHRQPGAYAPYGLGSHSCLGAGQAEVLSMLTIAALLRSMRLELDPPDYTLGITMTILPAPSDKFCVRVVERRPL